MKSHLDKTVLIKNALTGDSYSLQPICHIAPTKEVLATIARICNQDLVYEWCFKDLCGDKGYPIEMAIDWIQWGTSGWEDRTHFVYAILDSNGEVTAACDIKSSDLERAEVGYWSSLNHRGVMTNAAKAMLQLADNAGFKTLFADIHPDNHKSQAVIKRCGFIRTDHKSTIEGHIPFDRVNPN